MKYKWLRLGVAMVGLCLVFFGGRWFTAHLQARDDAAIARQFVGMWRLVSWTQRLADGTMRKDPRSVGYLIYTNVNRVCFVSMDPTRPPWKSETTPSAEEALAGIIGFGAYCATVEIKAKEGFVLHHVEIDRVPNVVGRTRKRWPR